MRPIPSDVLRRLRLPLVAGIAVIASLAPIVGSSSAQFTASAAATTSVRTRAACGGGTSYSTLLSTPAYLPSVWWRFSELTGTTTVLDASGHGRAGVVSGTGLTFGTANAGLIACDTTYALRQAGAAASNGFVATTTPVTSPSSFTIATWIRSASLTGGRIVGFGDSATAGSTVQDRALLLDRSGRAVLQIATTTGNVLVTSPTRVTDNLVHLVVASFDGTTARLYVDGAAVASAPVAAPRPAYAGYWRAGWDQNVAALITGARNQATLRQDELAIWEERALTAPEIAALFASNHW